MSIVDSMSERYIEQIEDLRAEIERLRAERDQYLKSSIEYGNLSERLRTALEEIAEGMYLPDTPPREIVSSMRAAARAALGATDEQRGPSE